jgi:type 1 glutamine amidotransferase
MKKLILSLLLLCFISTSFAQGVFKDRSHQVLVFTKTMGWRHQSIETGVHAIRQLGKKGDFNLVQTEDAFVFQAEHLKQYDLVIFLSTTLDVLDDQQQKAFEAYIQQGGSYMGIHAACDTEYDWSWYGQLAGGYFNGHPNNPNVREATIQVVDKNHASTKHLPQSWVRSDEWYNYKDLNPDIHVVLNLDESTYEGGTNGASHPIAWYHEFDGGKSFYTGGGHTVESYYEPAFLEHLLGGINYCLKKD